MIGFWLWLIVMAALLAGEDGLKIAILFPVIAGFIGGAVWLIFFHKEAEEEYNKKHGKRY